MDGVNSKLSSWTKRKRLDAGAAIHIFCWERGHVIYDVPLLSMGKATPMCALSKFLDDKLRHVTVILVTTSLVFANLGEGKDIEIYTVFDN